jgi:hypothetical protein
MTPVSGAKRPYTAMPMSASRHERKSVVLFDHLVSAGEQHRRGGYGERLGRIWLRASESAPFPGLMPLALVAAIAAPPIHIG